MYVLGGAVYVAVRGVEWGAMLLRGGCGEGARVRVSIGMCRACHAAFAAPCAALRADIECHFGHAHRFVGGVCSCGDRWR